MHSIMMTLLTLAMASSLAPAFVSAGCPATCSNDSLQLSCQNSSTVEDACCFNAPGGALLQTQFWDYDPSTGPTDAWTVHGLWPDNCDGTYESNCDAAREYNNITQIFQSFGQQDVLSYMQTYWKDYQGEDESFWEHEWGKHGTCISTLEPTCYEDYTPQEEVVDFFIRTVNLYQSLDTYKFLEDAGIIPSNTENYTLKAVQDALSDAPGREGTQAYVDCDNSGAINQAWYYFNVKGSVQTGDFVPVDIVGSSKTSCPDSVVYPPKGHSSPPSTPASSSAEPTATLDGTCRLSSKK